MARRIDIVSDTHGYLAPELKRLNEFTYEGLRFAVAHYRERLPIADADVAGCGHTHRAMIERDGGCLVVNPGSASLPRGRRRPAIAIKASSSDGAFCVRYAAYGTYVTKRTVLVKRCMVGKVDLI